MCFDVNEGTHEVTKQPDEAVGRTAIARAVGGCSAVERGASSPVLGPGLTQPFRWEIVPEPNPDCAVTSALGEADTREQAEHDLRRALAGYAVGFGFLYEVTDDGAGAPAHVRELTRIPIAPRAPKPPVW